MRPLRILLVEDDETIRFVLSETLESLGHHVCATASTEAEAIAAAARFAPELMIVDMQLAEGSGVAAVAAVLANGYVPHVFMSGARSQQSLHSLSLLRKPFRQADLVRSMQAALAPGRGRDTPLQA